MTASPDNKIESYLQPGQRAHLVGIGGVSMRPLGLVLKGMAVGNALALAFCAIQGSTHLLKLNPENYFISFVPVSVNLPMIILADAISYLVIMVLLLIPAMFISKIDPAQTVRAQ